MRTPNLKQRETFEKLVLSTLKNRKTAIGKSAIIEKTGLTPTQVYTTLARLRDAGTVSMSGDKRGAKYSFISVGA